MYEVRITRIDKDVPYKNKKDYQGVGIKDNGDKEYGYVYFDDVKDVSTEVYRQQVEDLELVEVIKAVNRENK